MEPCETSAHIFDLDDLAIFTKDSEPVARYKEPWKNRRHKVTIDISMPSLSGVEFSGAVHVNVSGFENAKKIDLELSGASKGDFSESAKIVEMDLSAASQINLTGSGQFIDGELSEASELKGLVYQAEESDIKF